MPLRLVGLRRFDPPARQLALRRARDDGDNDRDIDTGPRATLDTHEIIQFVFLRITLTDLVSNTTAQDDREAPVQ